MSTEQTLTDKPVRFATRLAPWWQDLKQLLDGLVRPAHFAGNQSASQIEGIVARGLGVVLVLLTLLLVVTALVNATAIRLANENLVTVLRGGIPLYQNPGPLGRLFFPVYFVAGILVVGTVRHGAMVAFGEVQRSLRLSIALSALAVTPFIVAGGSQGILNNLFPVLSDTASSYVRIGVGMFLTFLTMAWEGFVCIVAFKHAFKQNWGRAVLTWFSPFVFTVMFVFLTGLFLNVFMD